MNKTNQNNPLKHIFTTTYTQEKDEEEMEIGKVKGLERCNKVKKQKFTKDVN